MRQRSDYPIFSDREIATRHQAVYRLMERENVDALLIYGAGRYASDVYWLSDWPSSREAYVLFQTGKEPVILLQLFNHFPMAKVMSVITDVRWAGANTTNSVLGEMADQPSGSRVLARTARSHRISRNSSETDSSAMSATCLLPPRISGAANSKSMATKTATGPIGPVLWFAPDCAVNGC